MQCWEHMASYILLTLFWHKAKSLLVLGVIYKFFNSEMMYYRYYNTTLIVFC